jgi:hemerythrin-like domain-containing protein
MKATNQLRDEHAGVNLMPAILGRAASRLESGQHVSPDDLAQMLEFITVFADKCHHGKEEDLPFPAIEEAGIPREGGPISVMLREHDTGCGYVLGMRDAVAQYTSGDQAAAPRIAEHAGQSIRHLTQQIEKENLILFPMADALSQPGNARTAGERLRTIGTQKNRSRPA